MCVLEAKVERLEREVAKLKGKQLNIDVQPKTEAQFAEEFREQLRKQFEDATEDATEDETDKIKQILQGKELYPDNEENKRVFDL